MPKRIRTTLRTTLAGSAALFAALLPAGCDHNATDTQLDTPAPFFREVGLSDLQNALKTGVARVEVSIIRGGLVARRVEVEKPDEITKPEEVRGRISAITPSGDHGTVTLAVGGVQVVFDSSTRFRQVHGPFAHADTAGHLGHGRKTVADLLARVQSDLAAGRHPAVKARRQPPIQPQAPDDGNFIASELEFDHGADHPSVKLNVSAANLTTNSTPPPDAWLKLLGAQLELRVSDRTTRLAIENPRLQGVRDFDGTVQSVDEAAGTVTLTGGMIIRIVAGTVFEPKEGHDDDRLTSLADVAAALAAGKTVTAEGKGLVETSNPLTLDAIKIEFKET